MKETFLEPKMTAGAEPASTREKVRRIVLNVLQELDDRIRQLEQRTDRIEERVAQLEEVFGFIPTVPPAPLIRSSIQKGTGSPEGDRQNRTAASRPANGYPTPNGAARRTVFRLLTTSPIED